MRRRATFMRHGESEYNVLGLCNDDPRIPVALTAHGRSQVGRAATGFEPGTIDLLYVSQLPRALETAAIINRTQEAEIAIDPRLNDRRTGFEGRRVADYLAARDADPANFCAEGGESFTTLKARVLGFLGDLRAMHARRVLVVSHHEVLQIVRGHTLGWSDNEMRQWWIEPTGSFSVEIATQ
ncbi:MAG: histidine phosphatase family protein [Betaproteobacteria bacterium]|nr:histidine phosphatase family protein [Betaproteobacteria bacterium]